MSPSSVEFDEEPVLTLPDGCPPPHGITADGHFFGFWEQPDKKVRFHWDGRPGEPFDFVLTMRDGTTMFWSDDACHVAYLAGRDGKGFVGRDGTESPDFDDLTRSVPPVFSAGGGHLAYGAMVGTETRLFIDGAVAGTAELAPVMATFSPDGRRLAYVEMRPSGGRDPEFRVVLDGAPGEWFIGMRNAYGVLQFSPDSARFAYYRIDGKGSGQWILDGVAQRWIDDSRGFSWDANVRGIGALEEEMVAAFSPDSRRFAYFADVKERGVAVVENDSPGPLVKAVRRPTFSPDSRNLAYAVQDYSNRWFAIRDNAAGIARQGTGMGEVVFSADSGHLGWMHRREEGGFLRKRGFASAIVDDAPVAEVEADDMILTPVFRSHAPELVWWTRLGNQTVVYIGTEAGPSIGEGSDPTSTASGRVVYAGAPAAGQVTVYVDNRPGPIADNWLVNLCPGGGQALEVGLIRFSPDGEHVAWAGVFDGRGCPVLDHRVGPAYDTVLGWSFGPDGTPNWWAQRVQTLLRVQARPT